MVSESSIGVVLAVLVPVMSWQATLAEGPIEKLADQWPLLAVFCIGLYLLFRAYQSLAEKLIEALNKNTAAFTESAAASKRLAESIEKIDQRLDRLADRVDGLERERAR